MAQRWQKWMPFHIDRWKGSAHVQAMRAAARAGYLYLLTAMWQTPDCTLPIDQEDLQVLSGLMDDEWQEYGRSILRRFTEVDGRLTNLVLREEWTEAKRVFDARSDSARKTTASRSPKGDRDGDRSADRHGHRTVTERSPSRQADTQTKTRTETETREPPPYPPQGEGEKTNREVRQEPRSPAKHVASERVVGMQPLRTVDTLAELRRSLESADPLQAQAPSPSVKLGVPAMGGREPARSFLHYLHKQFTAAMGGCQAMAKVRPGWEDPLEAWKRCFEHVRPGDSEMDGETPVVHLETDRLQDLVSGLQRYQQQAQRAMRLAFGGEVQLRPQKESVAA